MVNNPENVKGKTWKFSYTQKGKESYLSKFLKEAKDFEVEILLVKAYHDYPLVTMVECERSTEYRLNHNKYRYPLSSIPVYSKK